jgi:hypothetical protein
MKQAYLELSSSLHPASTNYRYVAGVIACDHLRSIKSYLGNIGVGAEL